jgi:hypothetical protein
MALMVPEGGIILGSSARSIPLLGNQSTSTFIRFNSTANTFPIQVKKTLLSQFGEGFDRLIDLVLIP